MKMPSFLVIGAPKSGTTSLFYYLRQHPDIFLPVRKELHYFSYLFIAKNSNGPGDRVTLGSLCSTEKDYKNHYKEVSGENVIGEFSPSYFYYSDVAKRIKKELGSVKIIVMLRNPAEKAYSQYMHLVRDQRETLSFYDALIAETERKLNKWSDFWRYASSSLYSEKLKIYQSVFGHDNVQAILFDDFTKNPDTVLIDILDFLGVDTTVKCNTSIIYNRSGISKSKSVANFFSRPNSVKSVVKSIIPERIRIPIRLFVLNLNTGMKSEMDSKSREFLSNYFRADVKELEGLLNRKTGWLQL